MVVVVTEVRVLYNPSRYPFQALCILYMGRRFQIIGDVPRGIEGKESEATPNSLDQRQGISM